MILQPSILTLSVLSIPAVVSDWPQWRGPDRTNVSSEKDWKVKGAKKWEASVGLGYSSVVIADEKLYTHGHDVDAGEDTIYCLDVEDGGEIWTHRFPCRIWKEAHEGGSLVTPSIDGDVVYSLEREGQLFCLNAEDGKVLVEKKLADEWKAVPGTWGFAASPLVLEDMVVLNVGRVVAVKKKSLEVLWKTDKDYGDAYATATAFDLEGQPCLAVFNRTGLVVLERKTGEEVARHPWETQYNINAATPIALGSKVFISSGYNRGCALVDFTGKKAKVVWESKVMRNHMSGCVLYLDHLYGFDDNVLKCIDLQGNEKWRERDTGKGALTLADGKLIVASGKGELLIAEASPSEFKALNREKVLDGGVYWTPPVLCDGCIYIRNNHGQLVCLDHSAKTASGAARE